MPKLGESVQEATITKWFVKEGDTIEEDDPVFEVATDKVDSEIPSPVDGVISKIFFQEEAIVPVGEVVATVQIVDEEGDEGEIEETDKEAADDSQKETGQVAKEIQDEVKTETKETTKPEEATPVKSSGLKSSSNRFYSPLVKSIAEKENILLEELESLEGSGQSGRVQKNDLLKYIEDKKAGKLSQPAKTGMGEPSRPSMPKIGQSIGAGQQIIEMDRVRKLIAEHMVRSKQTSAHVTSVVEADVTNLVLWRTKVKDEFAEKYGEKITYMPVFTEAVAKALMEFPIKTRGEYLMFPKDCNRSLARNVSLMHLLQRIL